MANARETWSVVQGHAVASLEQLAALECHVLQQARGEHSWVERYLAFHACILRTHGSNGESSRTMQRSTGNALECSWQGQALASLCQQLEPLVGATKGARAFLHEQACAA